MTIGTGGTNATTSLSSVIFSRQMAPADIATIANGVKSGQGTTGTSHPIYPGSFSQVGKLYLPGGRGFFIAQPGDYIMLDVTSGWPILVSAHAIAVGPWTHT